MIGTFDEWEISSRNWFISREISLNKGVHALDKKESSIGTIEEVVVAYTRNVKRAARRFVILRMYDKSLQEDFMQQGYIGLIEAYAKFNFGYSYGHFWSYAHKFVKGRMVDFAIQYLSTFDQVGK